MGNVKICGQKLRMAHIETARTEEELRNTIEKRQEELSRSVQEKNQRELSKSKKEAPGFISKLSPNELEIHLYHKAYELQMEYFNDKEIEYYENLLKLERLNRTQNKLKKKIKCKEDKLLGAGSFGTVTRGFCVNNRMTMAVKRIRITNHTEEKNNISDLEKEVALLSELKHSNVVIYYDSEREEEYLKIYLEYVDMGSIASMLKTYGPLPEEVVAQYTRQILEGLEYLHYHGIMHRDIKGANILVHSDGTVKLADFGSAKNIKNYGGSFIGTVCWMAPEVT